jgi:hypothetical protein
VVARAALGDRGVIAPWIVRSPTHEAVADA